MWQRMWRAAKLDPAFYEMVEADPRYLREAFLVVLVAAVASGVGTTIAYPGETVGRLLTGILGTFVFWVAWAGITLWVGTTITETPDTRSDMGEMLRVLGYAHTPLILIFFVFIPVLGPLLASIGSIWSLVASIVAIRQALDFNTSRALVTAFIGWIVVLVLRLLMLFLF